jgi:hypothetical protein
VRAQVGRAQDVHALHRHAGLICFDLHHHSPHSHPHLVPSSSLLHLLSLHRLLSTNVKQKGAGTDKQARKVACTSQEANASLRNNKANYKLVILLMRTRA